MILLFPPPLCQTFFCVLLRTLSFLFHSFPFLLVKKTKKKRKKKERTRDDFFPKFFFLLSFFCVTRVVLHAKKTAAQRTESYKTREERERERERERKRSTTAEGEKGKRWRTTTNGCLREDVNLETTQKK